ncbi:hypothetical protein EV122DRAFT_213408 [Schizophyllum commune]
MQSSPPTSWSSSSSSLSSDDPICPKDNDLLRLWLEAIEMVQRETQMTIPLDHDYDSPQAIYDLVDRSSSTFTDFRHGRQKWTQKLRDKIEPIALIVQTLSGPLGDAVTLPFSPMKAVFGVIGVVIEASMKVKETFDDILNAFDSVKHYLRTIKPLASSAMHDALREASVQLLAQILKVLITIMKVQKEGRMKQLLKQLCRSKEVSETLGELERLANQHHQTVAAATLVAVTGLMARLADIISSASPSITRNEGHRAWDQQCVDFLSFTASSSAEQLLLNRQILERMEVNLLQALTAARNDRRKRGDEVYKWLSYQDSSARVNDLLDSRISGTGSWFLQHPDTQAFLSGDIRVLWLHGTAGSGKSSIMAMAIRHVIAQSSIADEGRLVLMHFFDATSGSQRRNLREFLSSLICQLGDATDDGQNDLIKLCGTHKCGHSQPSTETLQRELDRLLESVTRPVMMVVDALDEAEDDTILPQLQGLCSRHRAVSLLVSSRTEVSYWEGLSRLSKCQLAITKKLVKGDITILLNSVLAGSLVNMKPAEVALVRETLSEGSEGNFRWTILQLQELTKVSGVPLSVRTRLQNMPRRLKDIYDQAASSIPSDLLETTRRLLGWLLFARLRLSVEEFAELVAFDFSRGGRLPTFDPELRPSSPHDVLTIINSTFVCYRNGGVFFAHNSVRDYLLDPQSALYIQHRPSHLVMVQMCLAYLKDLQLDPIISSQTHDFRCPLSFHAAQHWLHYVNQLEGSSDGIFESGSESIAAFIATCLPGSAYYFLHKASSKDLGYAVRLLLPTGIDPNTGKYIGITSIHAAIARLTRFFPKI